ncbi:unannotated protein [freshwater metagenome]|uniref:methionyl-tRNA formyltransferase n=1 Tax=freshwater metagenome TaxID=449393 RepID=A0A6J6IFB2_9ZZZZ|nr:methionyl-tRNA formyltransferase [Actinomycetota bacterium]
MRIIFAGTPDNAAKTLESLLASGLDVVGILTREDARIGRSRVLTESPVASVGSKHGIEVRKSNSISVAVVEWMRGLEAQLGIVVAYGAIFGPDVLETPELGWINVHYSLLPEYPGAAPVQYALLDGKEATGVTIFRLDEGVDTGPILASKLLEIGESMNASSLLLALTSVGSNLLLETLHNFDQRLDNQIVQERSPLIRVAKKLSRKDAKLDFGKSARVVHNMVRAMNPEPVAWFETNEMSVRVLETRVSNVTGIPEGEAVLNSGELLVGCSDVALVLLLVQPAGKAVMAGADWFRGLRQQKLLLS